MSTWKPVPGHIMTRWAKDVTPENVWVEYPRPQMTRDKWQTLNGLWSYAVTPKGSEKPEFDAEILVPFAIESALSGVKRSLQPDEWLWYRRIFTIPADWTGQRVLLHFGAVDWECTIWVNGVQVGTHRGGYLPFYFDITHQLLEGENEVVVAVWDPADQSWIARGKQVLAPKGIWYTAVSGIWQSVWLEPVPEISIRSLKLTPDIEAQTLKVIVTLGHCTGWRNPNWNAIWSGWTGTLTSSSEPQTLVSRFSPSLRTQGRSAPERAKDRPGRELFWDAQIQHAAGS